MKSTDNVHPVSRRTALSGIGAASLGLALAARASSVSAQTPTAGHPIVGSWMVMNPVPSVGSFHPDGTITNVGVVSSVGQDGSIGYGSPGAGAWEALDDRAVHVTFVEFHTDANGVFTGTLTLDGYPVLAEDGQTWLDDGSRTKVTLRDASHQITVVIGGDGSLTPVTAYRMGPGNPGFPAGDAAATPTS